MKIVSCHFHIKKSNLGRRIFGNGMFDWLLSLRIQNDKRLFLKN